MRSPRIPLMDWVFETQNKLFKDDYPLPFVEPGFDGWGDAARTIVELAMCRLSATIREKPDWHLKVNNPDIRSKWRDEALAYPAFRPEWKLTEKMVDYVLDELHGYAKLIDKETGIQVGCYERVWISDSLVPRDVHNDLLAGVAILEDVPEEKKDWHPGSNGQVLDLVHPSLFPVTYGKTLWRPNSGKDLRPIRAPSYDSSPYVSQKYTWIPTDFKISENGVAKLDSPYINNLHPTKHHELYIAIEKIVTLAVPMWERVLSDMRRPMTPLRVAINTAPDTVEGWGLVKSLGCIWKNHSDGIPSFEGGNVLEYVGSDDEEREDEALKNFYASHPGRTLPDALVYTGALDAIAKTVSLARSPIQVIVKLANIILSPDKPEYPGGAWHVEGMHNEEIVSTFIWYYDEENITQSHLAFRTAVTAPGNHHQDDYYCKRILYNLTNDSALVQEVGNIPTKLHRCVAFPNIYQHQVQPFQLQDRSIPGHRKILALFLLNPTYEFPSTTNVAPQQKEWMVPELRASLGNKLPAELIDIIADNNDHLMTWDEALAIREAVMKERSVMVVANTEKVFGAEFNMCEH